MSKPNFSAQRNMFANCYEKKPHSFVSIANLFVIITVQEIDFIGYLSRLNVIKVVYCCMMTQRAVACLMCELVFSLHVS